MPRVKRDNNGSSKTSERSTPKKRNQKDIKRDILEVIKRLKDKSKKESTDSNS